MANTFFKFKKFTIHQDKTAMKVGTDGVLLGAWVNIENVKRILDVGTGTGLIAIMCAQRSPDSMIKGVEIEDGAAEQAGENFVNTSWSSRLKVIKRDFKDFRCEHYKKYDLIVSNPPFFINSLKNNCEKKTTARHADSLSHEDLIQKVVSLLCDNGLFSVVLPHEVKESFLSTAKRYGLFLRRILYVKPTPAKQPKRVLMEFSFKEAKVDENTLIVEQFGRHGYSAEYINLTKEFYLNF